MLVEAFKSYISEWMGPEETLEGDPFAQTSEEKIKELYAFAYSFYREKQYEEANPFFRFLVLCRPSEAKYWKGFAACLQMQREYEEAINCYLYAQMLNQDKPDPYLYVHAADCYLALKRVESGLKALEAARISAEDIQDQRVLRHVALMRDLWR